MPVLVRPPGGASCPENILDLPAELQTRILESSASAKKSARLVCRAWRSLVDASPQLAGGLALSWSTHLGARLQPLYPTLEEFLEVVARVAAARAPILHSLRLDMDAYGLPLARWLLALPLPRLHSLALQNAEPHHLMDLARLPRLRHLSLGRHLSGMVCPGPRAEGLAAQLAPLGARLSSLELRDYRMLGGLLGSLAGALPALRHLALGAARVEGGLLELAPLSRLQRLQRLELSLLGGRHGDQVVVSALAPGVTALTALTALHLAHVRAAEPAPAPPAAPAAARQQGGGSGGAGAARRAPPSDFWSSLALLPALAELTYEEQQLRAREPPSALLALPHLRSLTIRLEGFIHADDPPFSTWTALPPLPPGALPGLRHLSLDCVGLQALPPSWCAAQLTALRIDAGVRHRRAPDALDLPPELALLAPTLRRLELPACGLRALPQGLGALTGLTRLDLSRNRLPRLPEGAFDTLSGLVEVDLLDTPVANPGPALQRCGALRRLVVGARCQAGAPLPPSSLAPPTPAGKQRRPLAGGSRRGDSGGGGSSSSSLASAGSMDAGDGASASSGAAVSPAQSWKEELALQLPWVSEVVVGSA